jgi:hypothetical protein
VAATLFVAALEAGAALLAAAAFVAGEVDALLGAVAFEPPACPPEPQAPSAASATVAAIASQCLLCM